LNRLFGRFLGAIRESWHMYPLGLLFGLGFDTASEVGLLALSAAAATRAAPVGAVLALPILFAAGMSLMDTADGAFMTQCYGWAFSNPVRKVYYNLTVTSMSVAVALGVGGVELLQVLVARLGLTGGVWSVVGGFDFATLGYGIVAFFVLTWLGAYAIWKLRRIEERWGARLVPAAVVSATEPVRPDRRIRVTTSK
jgi:high-affinity nickel-transport protein